MKLRQIFPSLCALLILTTQPFYLNAQITIGSNKEPVTGALLDLKQNNPVTDGGTDSNKGLGLPRVELVSITSLSMSGNTIPNLPTQSGNSTTWKEHTGLMVYNTNECLAKTDGKKGIYIWDGEQWQQIQTPALSPHVNELIDPRDGEKYLYRAFGDPADADFAGYWMLENLRYDPKRHPDVAGGFDGDTFVHSAESSDTDKHYAYAEGDETYKPEKHPSADWDQRKRRGLLYNWAAATNKQNLSNTDQGQQADGTDPTPRIQGICPPGWHLPSDKEWNLLEKEIYNNTEKYSNYTPEELSDPDIWLPSSGAWESTWETTLNFRGSARTGGHGVAMKSPCNINSVNKSLIPEQGGFSALLVGIGRDGSTTAERDYSRFHSSSKSLTTSWMRSVYHNQNTVLRSDGFMLSILSSVRCKQD